MAEFSPCASVHCHDGPCRLSAAQVIAAHAEVPPECPNRVRLADPQLQLEPLLNGTELHITPRAGLLLSSRPVAGRPKLITSLVESKLLVLLAPTAPVEWRNLGTPRAVRDDEPDGPPPGPVTEKSWIKIRVVDDASGEPIPNVTMLVKLPNGQEREFATRADGMIDVQDIDPGTCDVSCSRDDAELEKALDFVAMGETAANPDQEDSGDASQTTLPSGTRVLEIEEHRVQTGESLKSVAQAAGLTWQELARFNWGTIVPKEINEHLRDDVGCTKKTQDGFNYVFTSEDEPGIVYVPKPWTLEGMATEQTHIIRVKSAAGLPAASHWEIQLEHDNEIEPCETVTLLSRTGTYRHDIAACDAQLRGAFRIYKFPIGPEGRYDVYVSSRDQRYCAWKGLQLPREGQGENERDDDDDAAPAEAAGGGGVIRMTNEICG
ncbi:MAG: LysM peptidoglycan-binding domain-containing protein [Planctomycetes bacterium]|nr:LysM peptidoglycan-binding domain-containing protein [Planctomycetota bacterium]